MRKYKVLLLLILFFLIIPTAFASDNATSAEPQLSSNNVNNGITDSNHIYFNSSAETDGNGSQSSPYKYLWSSRITSGSTLHLADGQYSIDSSKMISSTNVIIGQSAQNTIITYSGKLFTVSGNLSLFNLTLNKASISSTGYLSANNVIFTNVSGNSYGSIYSNSGTLNISNSRFIDNNARQGGAIFSYSDKVYLYNSVFINNNASIGGAICSIGSNMSIDKVKAFNNTAIYYGGFLYKIYYPLTIGNSEFENNSANYGGALFCDYITPDVIFKMYNCNFTSNIARYLGSAVYSVLNNETFSNNNYINNELYSTSRYDINFESNVYTQIFYNSSYNGTIPSKYDLRDYGYVTPIRDQGTNGNCWAFAAIAALESSILKATGISYDFSEENMKNLMAIFSDYGWGVQTNTGGNNEMSIGYLTSWLGPVLESDDAYVIDSYLSPLIDSIVHVQNIAYLYRSNYTDNDAIKKAILDYGGVYTLTYSSSDNQYYSSEISPDHAVCIVGWDDNYSRSNFINPYQPESPPDDGAWICKNSWGSNWGYGGYYYVSYYDKTFAKVGDSQATWVIIFNETVKYNKIYQYDIIGLTDYLLTNQSTMWYKNSFNASSDQLLSAFSTYFYTDSNWTAEIRVNNELKAIQNGTAPTGYFTFNLDSFIPLSKGDTFEILLKIETSTEAWVPISEKVYATRTHYYPNVSFVSYDGDEWFDLYNYTLVLESRGHSYSSSVACIKAFAIIPYPTNILLDYSLNDNKTLNLNVSVLDQCNNYINGSIILKIDGSTQNFNLTNGKVVLSNLDLGFGIHNITAIFIGDMFYSSSNSSKLVFIQHDTNLSFNISNISYGGKLIVENTLKTTDGDIINAELLLKIGNKTYSITSNSIQTITDLIDAGNYIAYLIFEGDETHRYTVSNSSLTVSKADSRVSLNIKDIVYGENLLVNVSLVDLDGKLLNYDCVLNINGVDYPVKSNRINNLSIPLNAYTYTAFVYFKGSTNYNPCDNKTTFTVNKVIPALSMNIPSIVYGEDLIVNTFLNCNDNLKLSIKGVGTYDIGPNVPFVIHNKLSASNYTAYLYLEETINHISSNVSCNFTVSKANVDLTLDISDIMYGQYFVIKNSLIDSSNSLINDKLTLVFGSKSQIIDSNSETVLDSIFDVGSHDFKLIYKGSNNYNGATSNLKVRVNKATPSLSLNISNINFGEYLVVNTTLMDSNNKLLNENIVLSINNVNYNIKSNSLNKLPVLLNASTYTAFVYFNGNNNYNSVNAKDTFKVNKITPNLSLNIEDAVYGDDLVVSVSLVGLNGDKLNEECVLNINGVDYTVKSNSVQKLPVLLNTSKYTSIIVFNGNNNYNLIMNTTKFNVNPKNIDLSLNIVKNINNVSLIFKSVDKIDTTLNVSVNSKLYYLKMVNGEAILDLDNLDFGNYLIEAKFSKTNYNNLIIKDSFVIDRVSTSINSNDVDMYYHDGTRLYFVLTDFKNNPLSNKTVFITLNGVTYTRTTKIDGSSSMPLNLNSNTYSILIRFNGDNKYASSFKNVTVTIKSTVIANSLVKYYKNASQFVAKIVDFEGKPVIEKSVAMNINGVLYYRTTNSSGFVRLNINLNPDKYILTVINPETDEMASVLITVLPKLVENKDLVKYYRNTSKYSVKVLDDQGNPLSGVVVSFNINGVFYYRTSNENGVASLNINLQPDDYIITAEYGGYRVSNNVKVLSTIKTSNLVMNYRDGSKFGALILDNNNGNPLSGVEVTFNINGVFYIRTTQSNGIAYLNINLQSGKYIITTTYSFLNEANTIVIK
ncbi:MAG: hypothetical protein K6A34_03210 [Methanobrevibacter sp.]|nr:hypothetical protein [Methanobrevibacter sp.]